MTGGSDCPGLNAVIRAIVRKARPTMRDEILRFVDAWDGVMGRVTMPLDVRSLRGGLPRRHPARHPAGQPVRPTRRPGPGEGHVRGDGPRRPHRDRRQRLLTVSHLLGQLGLPIVGVPKTIDNDIEGTR
jgi:6-phosphofructokinase 1